HGSRDRRDLPSFPTRRSSDLQLSYTLIFTPPVEAAPVPGYSKGGKEVVGKEKETPPVPYAMPCWKNILNNTQLTVGVNNIFDESDRKSTRLNSSHVEISYAVF